MWSTIGRCREVSSIGEAVERLRALNEMLEASWNTCAGVTSGVAEGLNLLGEVGTGPAALSDAHAAMSEVPGKIEEAQTALRSAMDCVAEYIQMQGGD